MADSPAAISEAPRNHDGNSPDWDNVPFHVGCARCGADLRGQTDPKCKSCGLRFDWADAVPIEQLTCKKCGYHLYGLRETRCPECGSQFTWEEALARFHRQRLPYFEYRWRDRPIRSFIRTWWMSLRPRKFWRTMQLHDPPQRVPLVCQLLISLVLLLFTITLVHVFDLVAWPVWVAYMQGGQIPISYTVSNALRTILSLPPLQFPILIAAWWATSFGALLIFQQSMRRFSLRTVHVLRIVAYTMPATVIIATIVSDLMVNIVVGSRYVSYSNGSWIFTGSTRYGANTADEVYFFAGVLVILHVVWSLRCAYKYHLKMPHSFGVAIAAQIIAILAAPIVAYPLIWLINS
ncbi:MAG: hypothetical protein HY287_02725 [Planctomycetes bacterium]|nr:hypothetical protein [Planctomycetota bacterium]MBI3833225.1 hypothetical protein [Planctomycetota bacterium]